MYGPGDEANAALIKGFAAPTLSVQKQFWRLIPKKFNTVCQNRNLALKRENCLLAFKITKKEPGKCASNEEKNQSQRWHVGIKKDLETIIFFLLSFEKVEEMDNTVEIRIYILFK